MNVVRTIGWIIATAIVVAFVSANYGEPQEVRFWFGERAPVVDWPVGVIALVFLLIGLVPMWLVHRAARWQWRRRLAALEAAARVTPPAAPAAAPPVETPSGAAQAAPEVPAQTTPEETSPEETKA